MRAALFSVVTIFACAAMAAEYYSDMYDKTNVDLILKNERLFKPYMACILDKGPCTADARAFKMILPDAITTNCARCTSSQLGLARKIVSYLKEHRPESYELLIKKYDPERRFIDQFDKFIEQDS